MVLGQRHFGSSVSTHSRLKAAGPRLHNAKRISKVSTHSRLKAAGRSLYEDVCHQTVSTHSRLKAAGPGICVIKIISTPVSTHSRLKAAGLYYIVIHEQFLQFQHTAA